MTWTIVLNSFLQGAAAMGCVVAGLFFIRYSRNTHDRFFLFFVAAFWAFALNWVGLAVAQPSVESTHWFYLLRLAAFLLLIAGIVDKNRRTKRPLTTQVESTTTSVETKRADGAKASDAPPTA